MLRAVSDTDLIDYLKSNLDELHLCVCYKIMDGVPLKTALRELGICASNMNRYKKRIQECISLDDLLELSEQRKQLT